LTSALANEACIDDEHVPIAAVIHGTLEDTETTEHEPLHLFGTNIAGIVMEMTDDKSLPRAEGKRLQVEHAANISRCANS
jgi:GTP diphosphokinase / guanosine-3',5'-bis(diphosphate) 3'-diphosphatase